MTILEKLEAARRNQWIAVVIWIVLALENILIAHVLPEARPNLAMAVFCGLVALAKIRTLFRIDHAIALRRNYDG